MLFSVLLDLYSKNKLLNKHVLRTMKGDLNHLVSADFTWSWKFPYFLLSHKVTLGQMFFGCETRWNSLSQFFLDIIKDVLSNFKAH